MKVSDFVTGDKWFQLRQMKTRGSVCLHSGEKNATRKGGGRGKGNRRKVLSGRPESVPFQGNIASSTDFSTR